MKCFSLLFLFVQVSMASVINLYSQSSAEVSFGDIVKFKVKSELDYNDLVNYKNKRINDRYYNLDVYEENNEIYFESIISQMEKKEKIDAQDRFEVYGVNFKFKKIQLDNKIKILDENIKLEQKEILIIILSIFFIAALLYFMNKILKRKKEANRLKFKREKLKLSLNDPSRSDLEKIYLERELIKELYDFPLETMENYINYLNKFQYQSSIPEDEFAQLAKKYDELIKQMKAKKSGI